MTADRAAPDRTRRARLPAAARLKTQRHFSRVYQRGARAGGQLVTVVALRQRTGDGARLGVSVSKDHGGAVRRNKIKRLLREAFRLERHAFPAELDVVLIPRQRPGKLLLAELRAELCALVERILAGRARPNGPRPRRAPGPQDERQERRPSRERPRGDAP
ncbi:MAG: ribonuclease P protein component [Planctomycetota bacterium]